MRERFENVIKKYVPGTSLKYCVDLWDRNRFSFKVTRSRRSKLGDYRFHRIKKIHIITVNGSLNPYAFLLTYIHEVAHLVHFETRGKNQPPHGRQWKQIFRQLMEPVLTSEVFPPDLLKHLNKHMINPKASSQSDPQLSRLFRKYDPEPVDGHSYLEAINLGEFFQLLDKTYEKLERRRTRSLCQDIRTGKRYLISEMARVRKVDKR